MLHDWRINSFALSHSHITVTNEWTLFAPSPVYINTKQCKFLNLFFFLLLLNDCSIGKCIPSSSYAWFQRLVFPQSFAKQYLDGMLFTLFSLPFCFWLTNRLAFSFLFLTRMIWELKSKQLGHSSLPTKHHYLGLYTFMVFSLPFCFWLTNG